MAVAERYSDTSTNRRASTNGAAGAVTGTAATGRYCPFSRRHAASEEFAAGCPHERSRVAGTFGEFRKSVRETEYSAAGKAARLGSAIFPRGPGTHSSRVLYVQRSRFSLRRPILPKSRRLHFVRERGARAPS